MDETKEINFVTPIEDVDQVNNTFYDPREIYPYKYFDAHVYDGLYYDDICMSCSHWIDGICVADQGVCDYEHY